MFHNPEMKVGGKPYWIITWYQKGLIYVIDLLAENGKCKIHGTKIFVSLAIIVNR